MATIINTPSTPGSSEGGAGWSVAVIILLIVIGIGAYFWLHRAPAAQNGAIDVNVTLPTNNDNTSEPAQ